MDEFFELINRKNKCLEKFYKINRSELINLKKGIFKNMKTFYERREAILEKIKKLDYKIESINFEEETPPEWKEEQLEQAHEAMAHRSHLVSEIVSQDLHIISFVEDAKSKMIKDLIGLNTAQEDFIETILQNNHHKDEAEGEKEVA